MEKAFWDGIVDSVKQDEPNYDRIIQLVREVRDEISEMAPQSWREEIAEVIDPEILSQVVTITAAYIISSSLYSMILNLLILLQLLNSGNLDIDYLGRILEFALTTLQKLSTPANDDDMKASREKLLKELAEICQAKDESNDSRITAMIKGVRFALQQIRVSIHASFPWCLLSIFPTIGFVSG